MCRYALLAAGAAFLLTTAEAAADGDMSEEAPPTLSRADADRDMSYGAPPGREGETHERFDWSGAYGGVAGAWLWGEDEAAMSGALEGGPTPYDTDGFAAGGFAGFNLQWGYMVYGGEFDIEYIDLSGGLSEAGSALTKNVDIGGSLRGRAGFAWERFLLYGTGGLAVGHVTMDAVTGTPPVVISSSDTVFGYTFGGGLEVGLWDSWAAGVEYRYTDFGDTEHSGEFTEGTLTFSHSNTFHAVRARLIWRMPI